MMLSVVTIKYLI